MMNAFNITVCQKCTKTVPSAPGFCVACGHEFRATVHVVNAGVQSKGSHDYPLRVTVYTRGYAFPKELVAL